MPGASGLLLPNDPKFTIIAATKEFAEFAGADMGKLIGSSLFEYFPDNPEAPISSGDIRKSLAKCMETKQVNELEIQRYDLTDANGIFHEMYWTVIHTPILDESGDISFIIHTAVNKTESVLSEKKDLKIESLEFAGNIFRQSSIAIHIFSGPDMIITLANDATLNFWGKDSSIVGKPLLEVMPEIKEQGFPEIIRDVYTTGKPFEAKEKRAILNHHGEAREYFLDIILQPFYEFDNRRPAGVMAMVNDVTQSHHSMRTLAEKEKALELAVEIGDLGVFNIDLTQNVVNYSHQIMEWFGVERLNLPLTELFKKVHPDDIALVSDTFRNTAKGKINHDITFRVPHAKTGKNQYLRSIGQLQTEEGNYIYLSGIIQDITNVVRTRVEVEESEQRLRSFIQSAPFPIGIYIGREMRVEMANQAIIDVWGKGPDIVGKTYFENLPELAGTGIYESLERVFDTGEAYHANNQRIELVVDGIKTPFYFNYSFTPLIDGDGKIYGVMNTAADVTDLNIAKKKVEESEDRYRTLIEESTVAAALYLGNDLVIQYANDLMISYWGKDKSVIGKTFRDAIPELQGQPFEQFLQHVFESGKTYSGLQEKAVLDVGDGLKDYYFNYTYKALRDADGAVYGIHHMAVDVTAEVHAKQAIEETARNFRNMILQAPVAICILRGEGLVFENVNRMMEEVIGKKAAEVEGKSIFEAMPELENEGLQPVLQRVMREGLSYISDEQEFHLLRDGKIEDAYIRYIYEPMIDLSGQVEGVMVVATDVTQQALARRKIEEIVSMRTRELAEANQHLQRSNAELEQFAYIASHDLQEPLRKISLFTQMLESSLGDVSDRARNQMERINNSVGRMTNLIRDILGYSQLSRKNDVFVEVDLEKAFEEAVADFDLILQEKGGTIEHIGLPVIEAIPLQMIQLFNNLVSNALKYSKPDVSPRIIIKGATLTDEELSIHKLPTNGSGYVKLRFCDNGIGFAQEYADKIFQIFQRLHGKMQYEGTGIGLAMCRKIAENHKGLIYAVGHEGKGAEFVVILPVKQL